MENLGVRVEKEDPPGIQRAQCTVVGLRKTSVDALHDPSTRELGLDELTCFVGRFVVDDDDVELDLSRRVRRWSEDTDVASAPRSSRQLSLRGRSSPATSSLVHRSA